MARKITELLLVSFADVIDWTMPGSVNKTSELNSRNVGIFRNKLFETESMNFGQNR